MCTCAVLPSVVTINPVHLISITCVHVLPSVPTNSYPSLDMHVLASMPLHIGIVWCLHGIMVDSTTAPPASESARISMNGEAVKRTDGDKDPGPDICSWKWMCARLHTCGPWPHEIFRLKACFGVIVSSLLVKSKNPSRVLGSGPSLC